jgi:hydrogenase maturation protein HypF
VGIPADGLDAVRCRVSVTGTVQGVGFRPFVHGAAVRLGLSGFVGNDARGVVCEVEGEAEQVAAFLACLTAEPPPLARIETVRSATVPPRGGSGFSIRASDASGRADALVAADSASCEACLAEMRDPADRRYRYPFLNCTHCGPRYTIVRAVPYDRHRTTMAGFPMCPDCRREYDDPADRRFHAQPTCCPTCGPRLQLRDGAGRPLDGDPLEGAAAALRGGAVLAVKGLGGYHLAVDATSEAAVARLRSRKHREERPFALMAGDVAAARLLCAVDAVEERLLRDVARPTVLLRRRSDACVAPSVAPGNDSLGVMLPYTPLHVLLLEASGGPLVLTSGNLSDEPIAYRDDDALERLAGVADAFLVSDRPIETRVDDSVARVVRGRPVLLRRSRGYVPQPVCLPEPLPRHVLACGPELKNTFALGRETSAFVSHHIGDLENAETLASYTDGIEHLKRLLAVDPAVVAHDLHPEYLSTKHALDLPGVDLVGVQHHHAHVASCLADNGRSGAVIGVAFDGLGLGTDGTLWGGEVLVADLLGFARVAHLEPVRMPGGAAAVRAPWRMAAAYLVAAFAGAVPDGLGVVQRAGRRWDPVLAAADAGINAPRTSSVGRLFDALAAVLDVRDTVTYEGQAAIELEQAADPDEPGTYPLSIEPGPPLRIRGADLVRAVTDDARAGVPVPVLAGRVHSAVADVVARVCGAVRDSPGPGAGLRTVALSGGVFQNALLLTRCLDRLEGAGFEVLTHRQVPPNDGGISLGQLAVAGALDRAGLSRPASAAEVTSQSTW